MVSVAERVPFDHTAAPVSAPAPSNTIDNILRLALNNVTASRQPAPAPTSWRPEPDFGMAAGLLDRATSTIRSLTSQRDELEEAISRQEELFGLRLRELQAEADEWERRAKVIKGQLEDSENRLAEQQMRVETLTFRAENAEARAAIAEQASEDAQRQSRMYHDKIVATLGTLD
jgi:2-phospho-L-lactate transferase/gluconeogenesis factor (CofD/UPF0052 family)